MFCSDIQIFPDDKVIVGKINGYIFNTSGRCGCYIILFWFIFLLVSLLIICIKFWKQFSRIKRSDPSVSLKAFLEGYIRRKIERTLAVYVSERKWVQNCFFALSRLTFCFGYPSMSYVLLFLVQFTASDSKFGILSVIGRFSGGGLFALGAMFLQLLTLYNINTKQDLIFWHANPAKTNRYTTEERRLIIRLNLQKATFFTLSGYLTPIVTMLPGLFGVNILDLEKGLFIWSIVNSTTYFCFFAEQWSFLRFEQNFLKCQARYMIRDDKALRMKAFLRDYGPHAMIEYLTSSENQYSNARELVGQLQEEVTPYLQQLEDHVELINQPCDPVPINTGEINIFPKIYSILSLLYVFAIFIWLLGCVGFVGNTLFLIAAICFLLVTLIFLPLFSLFAFSSEFSFGVDQKGSEYFEISRHSDFLESM